MRASLSVRSCVGLVVLVASGASVAQEATGAYSYSVTPFYHLASDLDQGGEASFAGVFASLGRTWALDEQSSLGFRLSFEYEDWDFSGVQGFGGAKPWSEIYRFTASIPYTFATRGGWLWNVTPTVGYTGESGARSSDAVEYGATASLARRVNPDLLLGVGIGAFEHIEDSIVFPFLIVNWQINSDWRLSNPLQVGPAGPAGLELTRTFGNGWETGLAAAMRTNRQRLDKNGPVPDGVGEHRHVPIVARVGRNLSETLKLDFYLGAETNTRLRIEDRDGNRLYSDDQDSGFLMGVSLTGRF